MTARSIAEQETAALYDQLYERCGKPLEAEHTGEYVAISAKGETLLGKSLLEVAEAARARLGAHNFLYKVGPRAVGKWR